MKKEKRTIATKRDAKTPINWDRLWVDPKYLRLHDRKSAKFRLFQYAQLAALRSPTDANKERLRLADATLTRAHKAINAYEEKFG